jgi:hypothetical protein
LEVIVENQSVLIGAWSWLTDNAYTIAWYVTLSCVIFAARIAFAFLKDNPRIFTVMALMACAWTLVLGFYGAIARGEDASQLPGLVSDIASFLLVYSGGLLILDTNDPQGGSGHVVPIQTLSLSLLLFIAAPRAVEIVSSPVGQSPLLAVSTAAAKDVVSALLVVVALSSIGFAVWRISSGLSLVVLSSALLIYGVSVLYANVHCIWDVCKRDPQISRQLALMFSALKLVITVHFGWIVAVYGMSPVARNAGLRHWVLHFFGWAPKPEDWRKSSNYQG